MNDDMTGNSRVKKEISKPLEVARQGIGAFHGFTRTQTMPMASHTLKSKMASFTDSGKPGRAKIASTSQGAAGMAADRNAISWLPSIGTPAAPRLNR